MPALNAQNLVGYRAILLRQLESRLAKNAGYSLRAFARDLHISVSSLSLILSGKQGLSPKMASVLAPRLGLSPAETEIFSDYVLALHGRSRRLREAATARIVAAQGNEATQDLSLEYFATISDWHYFAILELTDVADFSSEPRWIAERLQISETVVAGAIHRLRKLELLVEVDGRLRQAEGFFATPSGIPSRALREHHHQILKKAERALEEQSVDERDFASLTFAMNADDLAFAKEELRKFRRQLRERLQMNPEKNSVYTLNLNLFRLDRKPSEKK